MNFISQSHSIRERVRISDQKIQFMIIESLAVRIFGQMCGSQVIMENILRDLKILWKDEDNLVGSLNPYYLSSKLASVSFTP